MIQPVPEGHIMDAPTDDGGRQLVVSEPAPDPVVPDEPGELEEAEEVVDGELIEEVESAEAGGRLAARTVEGRAVVLRPAPRLVQVARVVGEQPVTLVQGWHSWLVRAWSGATYGTYRRQIRTAEAKGDAEALAEWIDRKERAVADRRNRLSDLPLVVVGLAKLLLGITVVLAVGLPVVGILVQIAGAGTAQGFMSGVGDVVAVVFGVLGFVGRWLWLALAVLVLAGGWREGRRVGTVPAWLVTKASAARSDAGLPITPSVVVTALRDLGIPQLRKAIGQMGDAGAGMLGVIRIAGCGVEVDVALPSGVTTEEVQKRRRKLAENLGRHEHEVFITIPEAARTVRLWIADSGALDEPIGPSPLVLDPDLRADYKSGRAPWGQDLRGDAASISLFQRHLLITGLSNQGKTASLRALALWLALDPRVEFRIGDLKGVGDWAMFRPLATVLIQGPTDAHVVAVTEMLEDGVAEMERRLLSPPGTEFDPLVLIADEAQVAFMCPVKDLEGRQYGGTKSTSRYFMAARRLQNQGRAVNVLLWQGTQNPTDQNLPVLVREGAHIRTSLAVGTESQSRMALGDKAVDGGASPHLLRQGLDKGTLVSNGEGLQVPPGQSSITIRTHFISDAEAVELARRAKEGRAAGGIRPQLGADVQARDLLEDLDAVLPRGDERVRLSDLPGLLRRHAPNWLPYRGITGLELRVLLTEHDVRVTNSGNVLRVDPADVRAALARRDGSE